MFVVIVYMYKIHCSSVQLFYISETWMQSRKWKPVLSLRIENIKFYIMVALHFNEKKKNETKRNKVKYLYWEKRLSFATSQIRFVSNSSIQNHFFLFIRCTVNFIVLGHSVSVGRQYCCYCCVNRFWFF